jgi:gluconolactonase
MDFEIICWGLQFPEGPVAMSDGSVLLVETRRQTVSRVGEDGTCEVVAMVGGGPNGLAIGPDGSAYICNNGGYKWAEHHGHFFPHGLADDYQSGSIQRLDVSNGQHETLYTRCGDRLLQGPNDIVFDRDDGFWFTDFGTLSRGVKTLGGLFYAKTDGSHIHCAVDGLVSPNGIGLSADGRTLYTADTFTGRLYALDVVGPGALSPISNPLLPGRIMGGHPSPYMFDSLAVQEDGGVAVATIGRPGVTIHYDEHTEFIDVPCDGMITNICFGGDNQRTAWLTGSQSGVLIKTEWPTPGLRLNN